MHNKVLALLAMVFLLATPVLADELVSVKLGYQLLEPSGVFGSDVAGEDPINMDELNFSDSEEVTAEVAFSFGDSRFALGYMPLSTAGVGSIPAFDGVDFTGAAAAKIDLDLYDISYSYYLLNFDDLPVRLQFALEAAVKVFDGEASVTGTETLSGLSVTESISGTAPIPTLGARVRVALSDFIGVTGRVVT